MAIIGLVVRSADWGIGDVAKDLFQWAARHDYELLLEKNSSDILGIKGAAVSVEVLVRRANPIVVLGGDGTMIKVARHVRREQPVLIGVNFGTLGFLTEITPAELLGCVERCVAGHQPITKRAMLRAQVWRGGSVILTTQAVNDVVVQKGLRGRLVDFDVYVEDQAVMRLRADGIIFSTPTGSTAYSLAAGGSIVHPSLEVVMLTPICAHSLNNRPLILPLESKLTVRIPEHEGEVVAVIDGQESLLLRASDEVRVTKSENNVAFASSPSKSYFEVLRNKLNWGGVIKEE